MSAGRRDLWAAAAFSIPADEQETSRWPPYNPEMKMLVLMRHGKAEAHSSGSDKGRVLTERGRRQASAIARGIASAGQRPDRIVSSDAVRARQTAEIVAEALDPP